jgi:hypothetical protein
LQGSVTNNGNDQSPGAGFLVHQRDANCRRRTPAEPDTGKSEYESGFVVGRHNAKSETLVGDS